MSKVTRLVFSWAQNATPIHTGFLASLRHYPGTLRVIQGRYKNPTSQWTEQNESDDWWAPELVKHLTSERTQLCPNLVALGDIRVQPTASRPLTGFETFVGKNSAIVGHPKRALETVATATRVPRILATTGAITLPNYTESKAGKRGAHHHVIGALVVEIDAKGFYWLRHISADAQGRFYDLDKRYTPDGVEQAGQAAALVLGDLHVGKEDWSVIRATRKLTRLLRPNHLVLHDVFDGNARNPHEKGLRAKFTGFDLSVRHEVEQTARALSRISTWGADLVSVVRSNHDEFLERYLEDTKSYEDPANGAYYHALWSRSFTYYADHGCWPNVLEMECKRLGVPKTVWFLPLNQSFKVRDVELSFHGHKGVGGSRGSPLQYAKLGVKTVTGHTHKPQIIDGSFVVGLTAKLDHGYNSLPGAWAHAHCVIYPDGKRALHFVIDGRAWAEA